MTKVLRIFARMRLRLVRGKALLSMFTDMFQYTAYLSIIAFTFGIELDPQTLLIFAPLVIIAFASVGWIDERVGIWRYENKYSAQNLNPQLAKLDLILKELKELRKNE